ncbi:MAG: AAA family ATPase [bacterium]
MYLEKIEIQGFKSFANKTVLHFPKEMAKNKGITAIVGPNGSGKSNIADAIKWVLGEQSIKTLRAKKSEDVIFSGSDKKARLGFAEVSLYLNNEDQSAPIEYSELVITRRLYRTGESEYILNKNKIRLQDLQIILAKSHIGQRTYSVIGQGMIDFFLIAPPHERKEFFDEAAGVKEYQIKRNHSLNKLILSHENLTKADLLLQEIEPRLKSLTRQMKRLEKREALVKELKKLQGDYFGSIKNRLEKEATEINHNLENLQVEFSGFDAQLNEIGKNLEGLSSEQSRNDVFEDIKNKYSRFIDEKNIMLQKQAVIKGNKEVEYKKAGKVNLVWLEKKQDEIKKEKDEISSVLESASSAIDKLQKEAKDISDKRAAVSEKRKDIEGKLRELQLRIFPKEIDGGDFKNKIIGIHNDYKILLQKLDLVSDLAGLDNIKEEARKIHSRFSEIMERISKDNSENKNELDEFKNTLDKIMEEQETAAVFYNNIMLKINTMRERKKSAVESLEKIIREEKNISAELISAKSQPGTNKELLEKLEAENKEVENLINALDVKIKDVSSEINEFNRKEEEKKEKLFNLQKQYQSHQQLINILSGKISEIKINLAKIETKKEDLEIETAQEEINLSNGFAYIESPEELIPQIGRVKNQLEIIGGIDPETEKEYLETNERFTFLSSQVEDLKKAIASLEKVIKELDETIKVKFEEAFNAINKGFQHYFKMLFNGGNSKLLKIEEEINGENKPREDDNSAESAEEILEDGTEEKFKEMEKEKNPLKRYKQNAVFGIEIQAMPPGKKVSSINMLSGGERTLTAIALLCAIISNNPAPFVVLDEVDAALDEANSHKLSNILDELSCHSQFIVITHNRATMQKSELLYGVTMGDDSVSKLLSIKFEEAAGALRK